MDDVSTFEIIEIQKSTRVVVFVFLFYFLFLERATVRKRGKAMKKIHGKKGKRRDHCFVCHFSFFFTAIILSTPTPLFVAQSVLRETLGKIIISPLRRKNRNHSNGWESEICFSRKIFGRTWFSDSSSTDTRWLLLDAFFNGVLTTPNADSVQREEKKRKKKTDTLLFTLVFSTFSVLFFFSVLFGAPLGFSYCHSDTAFSANRFFFPLHLPSVIHRRHKNYSNRTPTRQHFSFFFLNLFLLLAKRATTRLTTIWIWAKEGENT